MKFLEILVTLYDDSQLSPERQLLLNQQKLSIAAVNVLMGHANTWAQLLRYFQKSILIMDELDWVCHPMKCGRQGLELKLDDALPDTARRVYDCCNELTLEPRRDSGAQLSHWLKGTAGLWAARGWQAVGFAVASLGRNLLLDDPAATAPPA